MGEDAPMDLDEWQDEPEGGHGDEKDPGKGVFGLEVTNSPNKRSSAKREDGDEDTGTPLKKLRRSRQGADADSGNEWVPPAPIKRGKRKLAGRK